MSTLLCKCGEWLSWVECPSENIVHIRHESDVLKKLRERPGISAWDFYSEDGAYGYQYWYCPRCRRIQLVNIKRHVVSCIWRRTVSPESVSYAGSWTDRIFFISDTDLDRITDKDIDLPLCVLLERHVKTYLVSPDGAMVCSVGNDGTGTSVYELEDVIP